MSAFARVVVECRSRPAIVAALRRLGYGENQIEVHDQAQPLYGYHGDQRAQRAHVIVRRRHIGGDSNDIGFEQVGDSWVLHQSENEQHPNSSLGRRFAERGGFELAFRQAYAVEAAKEQLLLNRYDVTEEEVEDGSVLLHASQWM